MGSMRERRELINTLADTLSAYTDYSIFSSSRLREHIRTELRGHSHEDHILTQYAANSLSRRDFLKILGFVTASGAVSLIAYNRILADETITGMATAYKTVNVPAGTNKTVNIGSGQTHENYLYDITNSGANVKFSCEGSGWTLRNIGIKGKCTEDSHRYIITGNVPSSSGKGRIENVYLGDGCAFGKRKGAIICSPDHAGHVDVVNTHIGGWSANACYVAGPGRRIGPGQTDGKGGTYGFTNCYFHDNNIANIRCAADGTFAKDSVIHNTNMVPPHPDTAGGSSGVVNSRGLYTGYGDPSQTITVDNCDIEMTDANTCNNSHDYSSCAASVAYSGRHHTYGECSTINIINSRIHGRATGSHVNVASSTQQGPNAPNIRIPKCVPKTPEEAASGTCSTSVSPSSGGSTSSSGSTSPSSSNPC